MPVGAERFGGRRRHAEKQAAAAPPRTVSTAENIEEAA